MSSFLKNIRKKALENTLRPYLKWYLSKKRTYKYRNLSLIIFPGVFHPGFFLSTQLLLQFLETIHVSGKKVLELGAGSGLISLHLAQREATVFASDISPSAIKNIRENALNNKLQVNVIQSDIFDNMTLQKFDLIIVNPPYYPYDPASESEYAWYCGRNFQYFKRLFSQISNHINPDSEIYMILSEDCDLDSITKIALSEQLTMTMVLSKRKWWEWNYIYKIVH